MLKISFCLSLSALAFSVTLAQSKTPAQGSKPAPTPVAKPAATAPSGAAAPEAKPQASAADLVNQGKVLYQKASFTQALAKFEAALKLEPERDEALAFAAETAYRLDNQSKARTWFLKRAELPNQKDTIKSFNFYRAATTFWREAHDSVTKFGTLKEGKTVMSKLPEKSTKDDLSEATTKELIANGLDYIERCLTLTPKYAEAHNVKNLLLAESAWLNAESSKGEELQKQSLRALRQALDLMKGRDAKTMPNDFGAPTLRIGEFPPTKAEDEDFQANKFPGLEGGAVLKRFAAIFPTSIPRSSEGGEDNPDRAGRRGALTAATTPGKVKVEVLVSTAGDVTFAHVVQGRSDLNPAAVAAARKWKFEPAKFEGHAIQLSGVITFDMRPGRAAAPAPTPAPPAPKP